MEDLFLISGTIIAAFVGFIISWFMFSRPDEVFNKVLKHLTENYLDERYFTIEQLEEDLQMPKEVLLKYLRKLQTNGLVVFVPEKKKYALVDPLVFLTERDYIRALRVTKDDNIIYGAYQAPYRIDIFYIGIQFITVAIPAAIFVLHALGIIDVSGYFPFLLKLGISTEVFLLFLTAMGMIIADAFNNIAKGYMRERYSVVVGEKSGIAYDVSFADEFSGRVRRGEIQYVDLQLSSLQKIHNYFGEIPIGDVRIRLRRGRGRRRSTRRPEEETEKGEEGEEKSEEEQYYDVWFRSMPFPRELFYVIRSIQLGHLAWRKRYADVISRWRAGAVPIVGFRRRY